MTNPDGLSTRKCVLRVKNKHCRIYDAILHSIQVFGAGCTAVSDNCIANTNSYTLGFGNEYHSASERCKEEFLLGAENFIVKEIGLGDWRCDSASRETQMMDS
jgi:hypothetical protein